MDLKQRAEASVQKALETILEHIPHEEIVSVYVKGSYVHGTMNEESDVDLVVVLRTEKCFLKVGEISKEYGHLMQPPFALGMYTMDELKTGTVSPLRTKGMTPISRFIKSIDALPLLYGAKPEGELFSRSYERDLFNNIQTFRTLFLPKYAEGAFTFWEILKQVFWLGEAEQRVRGIPTEYSWQSIADSFPQQDHVMRDALKLRLKGEATEEEKQVFIAKLEQHLAELDALATV